MVWGAIIGAAIGLYQQRKAGKESDKAMGKQDEYAQEQLNLMKEQLGFTKQQYNDWLERYNPVYDDMMSHIDDGIRPDFEGIAGDVKSSFGSARDQELREMRRYGIKPTDGSYRAASRNQQLAESAAHVGVRGQVRQQAAGEKYRRLAGIHDSLKGVGSGVAGAMGGAYAGAGNSMGGIANMYGNRATMYDQRGAQDAAGWGQAIGGIDWGGVWDGIKNWGNSSGTGAVVPNSGGQSPQDFYSSDVRLKENLVQVGTFHGLKVYEWDWNEEGIARGHRGRGRGVLAQELGRDSPFVREIDGYLAVDYRGLVSSMRPH